MYKPTYINGLIGLFAMTWAAT